MTLFDMLFFLAILIGILAGIAGGVHTAYLLEDDEDEKNEMRRVAASTGVARDKHRYSGDSASTQKNERKKKDGRLSSVLRGRQSKQPFSEFECQFTDEDHDEKLSRVMGEQDEAYHILSKEDEPS